MGKQEDHGKQIAYYIVDPLFVSTQATTLFISYPDLSLSYAEKCLPWPWEIWVPD